MAHFRATIKGQRGEASRLGNAKSGIQATVNGWDLGVQVDGHAGTVDAFDLYATGGSNRSSRTRIGRVILRDGVPVFEPAGQTKPNERVCAVCGFRGPCTTCPQCIRPTTAA